jgi:hypothetical protein
LNPEVSFLNPEVPGFKIAMIEQSQKNKVNKVPGMGGFHLVTKVRA